MPQFERNLYSLFENLRRQILAQPLNLGGITASGGGTGGPPGGFIGQLPQYRSTFDETELAEWDIPGSGIPLPSGQSLLTNLNRIRYRLASLEAGSGISSIGIQEDNIDVGDATILNFEGGVTVIDEGGGKITVSVSGSANEEVNHIYNEDLVLQIPVVSGESFSTEFVYISGTLRLYYNSLRKHPNYYIEDRLNSQFIVLFDTQAGDEVLVDYNYLDSEQLHAWGEFAWGEEPFV